MSSFLTKAMELCNSMMQFTGCELYSHNCQALLRGMRETLNTIDSDVLSETDRFKLGCLELSIDSLLEEEGIAEAELLAYHYNLLDDLDIIARDAEWVDEVTFEDDLY